MEKGFESTKLHQSTLTAQCPDPKWGSEPKDFEPHRASPETPIIFWHQPLSYLANKRPNKQLHHNVQIRLDKKKNLDLYTDQLKITYVVETSHDEHIWSFYYGL